MAALTFDKKELGNLEYSLTREMLATDRRGGYMSTTIVGCNTRKYHGLIVAPIDDSGRDFVLLSSLDETIILDGQRFNLALHRFRGVYEPRGHKYITDFEYTPTPTITYRIGNIVLKKELLWIHRRTQLMVRYTIVEGDAQDVTLQLRPFLAFRDRHELSKANMYANGASYPVEGGVKCRLYDGFPWLNMQCSDLTAEFAPAPEWYNDFEYARELERGYEGYEDLLTPGFFELKIKCGESAILSASTNEVNAANLAADYEASLARRTHKIDFISCLQHSARQFLVGRADGGMDVIAGYPWYGVVGREALIALPGLTLEQGHKEDCMAALDTIVRSNMEDMYPSLQPWNAADAPLWTYRVWQELEREIGAEAVWQKYGSSMKALLNYYRYDGCDKITMHDNGLIWAWSDEKSLTWMDTTADSRRYASRRNGYQVEVNALWYNAVCYTLELANKFGDTDFVNEWNWLPERTKATFQSLFWLNEGWLADYVNNHSKEYSVRPNMIIACALNYKMVSESQQVAIIRTVQQHLLTPKGIRSLSPINPLYGLGGLSVNNIAPKNGSVWVWTLMFYVKACFDVSGDAFVEDAKAILSNFIENIQFSGIGSISEYFDADPPHHPRGSISQAWSVASLLEISRMIEERTKTKKKVVKRATAAKKPAAKKATTAKKSTAKSKKTE
ncbi:MAG: glycogen debranching enzyme N-terminal domain-containing protein [Rikenellaceae bacterium]